MAQSEIEWFELTYEEFQELKQLQVKRRWKWPATFSTNEKREVWAYFGPGYTRPENREMVLRGLCPTLDVLVDKYLLIRECGGRFFIDERGMFHKEDDRGPFSKVKRSPEIPLLQFRFIDPAKTD